MIKDLILKTSVVFLLTTSFVHASGEKIVVANLPEGVSGDLAGKILASKEFAATDFNLTNLVNGSARFTNSTFPIVFKKSEPSASNSYKSGDVSLSFKSAGVATPIDLSLYNGVHFIIENTSSSPLIVYFLPYDSASEVVNFRVMYTHFKVPAHSGVKHVLTTLDENTIFKCGILGTTASGVSKTQNGMNRCPLGPNQLPAEFQGRSRPSDNKSITRYRIKIDNMPTNGELKIHAVRAVNISYKPNDIPRYIDTFGQNNWVDFDGKVKTEQDLRNDALAEPTTLQPLDPTKYDIYGGDVKASGYRATGYFRTEKVNGKWWFVSPLGNLTYIRGINFVTYRPVDTSLKNREIMFKDLPSKTGNHSAAYRFQSGCGTTNNNTDGVGEYCGDNMWNPYQSNIIRKYTDPSKPFVIQDIYKRWGINTQNRLQDWGFNANFSVARVPDPYMRQFPYALFADFLAGHAISGTNVPDVFSPGYVSEIEDLANKFLVQWTGKPYQDPFVLGTYSDNEIDFGHMWETLDDGLDPMVDHYYLILHVLKFDSTHHSAAKRAFVDSLKAKYANNFAALKAAWNQASVNAMGSWDDFLNRSVTISVPTDNKSSFYTALKADLSHLLTYYAETYFSTAKSAIKKADPNHLYLGSRFASFHRAPPEAIDACVKYCDVYTVNYYNENMRDSDWNYLLTKDIPIMITEFTFGSPSNGGAWGGIIWFNSEAERVRAYTEFLRQWVDKPQSVGFFYHLYVDMPLSGMNFESENYYSSFVTTTDRPYPEMVNAAKTFNDTIYTLRGSVPKSAPGSPGSNATGDVSLNGRLSLYDSVLVKRYLSGYRLNQEQLDQADVVEKDRDIVNNDDAQQIAQYVMDGTTINQCAGGSLSDHLKSEVNTRIASYTAANVYTGKVLWTTRGNTTGGWVRSPGSWVTKGSVPLDLTGASPWNSYNPTINGNPYNTNGNRLAGTLITPRHLLFAAHAAPPIGTQIIFVDNQNNIVRPIPTVTAYRRILTTDIVVSTLSADMPSSIAYYPILDKAELAKYMSAYQNIPIMLLDQEDKALIKDTSSNFVTSLNISHIPSLDPQRALFNETIISGDSGNPGFVIINGKLVIVLTIHDVPFGPNLAYYKQLIQDAINEMTPTPAYNLPKVDLSCFDSNEPSS